MHAHSYLQTLANILLSSHRKTKKKWSDFHRTADKSSVRYILLFPLPLFPLSGLALAGLHIAGEGGKRDGERLLVVAKDKQDGVCMCVCVCVCVALKRAAPPPFFFSAAVDQNTLWYAHLPWLRFLSFLPSLPSPPFSLVRPTPPLLSCAANR